MVDKVFRGVDAEVLDYKQRVQHIRRGKTYYVDAGAGGLDPNGLNGLDWDNAMSTMTEAFAVIDSGDTIVVAGNVREQLTTPVGIFDVAIIGAGFQPRHADAHTGDGGYRSQTTWRQPASGATAAAMLRVQQQGWRLENMVFQLGSTTTIGVEAYKDSGSGDDERDGGHLALIDVRFVGTGPGKIGFQRTGGNGYCRVVRCGFQNLATAIAHAAGGGGQDGFHLIADCWFEANTTGIDSPLYRSRLLRNTWLPGHTLEFDLTGGAGNVWSGNIFNGLADGFETNIAGTGDFMIGPNWSSDTGSADVDASGFVSALPNGS